MYSTIKLTVVLLFVGANINFRVQAQSVSRYFEVHGVVPDVIPKAPYYMATVMFPSGASALIGNQLTPTQVKDIPSVNWPVDSQKYYTLVMIDLDAPSRADPEFRSFLHWMVVNIPGNMVAAGHTLCQYVGSGPPEGSGLHRYVILVYAQPEMLNFNEPRISNRTAENRGEFSVATFASKYNLGCPVAGNFFYAQYDDYVPSVHKQIGVS